MNKNQFLIRLDAYLYSLPPQNRQNILRYFSDKIDSAVAEGANEQEFINNLGFIPNIAKEIAEDYHRSHPRGSSVNPLKTAVLVVLAPLIVTLFFIGLIFLFSIGLLGVTLFLTAIPLLFLSPLLIFASFYAAAFSFGMGLALMGGGLLTVTATAFLAVCFYKLCVHSFNSLKEYIKKEV